MNRESANTKSRTNRFSSKSDKFSTLQQLQWIRYLELRESKVKFVIGILKIFVYKFTAKFNGVSNFWLSSWISDIEFEKLEVIFIINDPKKPPYTHLDGIPIE